MAVGAYLVCFGLSAFSLLWAIQVDTATCFGVHFSAAHGALISHGELEIARVSDTGAIVWSQSGRDIFTGDFKLAPDCIEVSDFDGAVYRFDYDDGRLLIPL